MTADQVGVDAGDVEQHDVDVWRLPAEGSVLLLSHALLCSCRA
jgi:hypothetical protein